jgi:hypothetical protein
VNPEEEKIKNDTLIDNTAQAIFNTLNEVENEREIYSKRWIWELLQNALDSAQTDRHLKVKVTYEDHKLIFNHDGRPFEPGEVVHLIYHGSTKREKEGEKDYVGKFGTGVLITHVLSKKVKVIGVRNDNKKFEFELDRDANSVQEIRNRMEETWKTYQRSLEDRNDSREYTVSYEYLLNDSSEKSAMEGIQALTKIAPYILAFDKEFEAIEIIKESSSEKFELVNKNNENSDLIRIIRETKQENDMVTSFDHELWIKGDNEIQVAIKVNKQEDDTYLIDDLRNIPKIFAAFPLFGTENLSFPAVVNSREFKTTPDRGGIFLGGQKTEGIEKNKNLIKRSIELFIDLIKNLTSRKINNLHLLFEMDKPQRMEWLDEQWYIQLLVNLIDKIFKLEALMTDNEKFESISQSFIPFIDNIDKIDKEKIEIFWDISNYFEKYRNRIPRREIALEWANIIQKWANVGYHQIEERKITINGVVNEIEYSSNVENLKKKLVNSINESELLNSFYKLLINSEKSNLLDKNILLNQNGNFKSRGILFKDGGIEEILKDISAELGLDVRDELLSPDVILDNKVELHVKKEEEVLDQILKKIKDPANITNNEKYLEANLAIFAWVLEHNKVENLDEFPVLSLKEGSFSRLSKKERLLAPVVLWNEKAREYVELFPQEFIISEKYLDKVKEREMWYNAENYILLDTLYTSHERIKKSNIENYLSYEEGFDTGKEHMIDIDVEMSDIVYLELKDKGVIDTIRNSKKKAIMFLNFLFKYVIETDNKWNTPVKVKCSCGVEHKIDPSEWLYRIKQRNWVPTTGSAETPNAHNIAQLIVKNDGGGDLTKVLGQNKSLELLRNLKVGISELTLQVVSINKDENTRIELEKAASSLFSTYVENPEQLIKISNLAATEPDFIDDIEEKIQTSMQIRRNQQIGSLVEIALKNALEKEGFRVERTGTGSDYLMEYDIIENEQESIIEISKEKKSFLVEVKSTRKNEVKMTITQGKTAVNELESYVLCVVKLDDTNVDEGIVRDGAHFVKNIGKKLDNSIKKIESLEWDINKDDEVSVEINKGQVRFVVKNSIWERGEKFDDFVNNLK